MDGLRIRAITFGLLALTLALLTGCSLSPASKLTLFPQGHKLTETAEALRQPVPVDMPRELEKRVLAPYIVEPGDVLLIQPANLDAAVRLSGDQPILPDGTINLGQYGRLVVAGKTVDEIEVLVLAAVQAKARAGDPPVGPINVRIITRVSKVYYVLGEVNAPGSFPLSGRETVLDGILAAGGLSDRASRTNIILSRPTHPDSCRIVLPICYRDIVQLGDTTTNYQLAPGDRIYVATRDTSLCSALHKDKKCDYCDRPQSPCALPPLPPPASIDCSPDHLPPVFGKPLTVPTVLEKPVAGSAVIEESVAAPAVFGKPVPVPPGP